MFYLRYSFVVVIKLYLKVSTLALLFFKFINLHHYTDITNSSQGERLDNELVTKLDALGPQKETQNQIKLRYMTS